METEKRPRLMFDGAEAHYQIGLQYLDGEHVEQNYGVAKKWIQKAAERGHSKAKEKLSLLKLVNLSVEDTIDQLNQDIKKLDDMIKEAAEMLERKA